MTDASQLPALLRLFDDDSESIQLAVLEALAGVDDLAAELRRLQPPPSDEVVRAVLTAVTEHLGSPAPGLVRPGGDAPGGDTPETDAPRPADAPRYAVGQLVRHRTYGYRGIVVARDDACHADDAWYRNNRTQPPRDQPWYHVLVDGTAQATYAAETSLLPDESLEDLEHPWLPLYFLRVGDGAYERNDRPWRGW